MIVHTILTYSIPTWSLALSAHRTAEAAHTLLSNYGILNTQCLPWGAGRVPCAITLTIALHLLKEYKTASLMTRERFRLCSVA